MKFHRSVAACSLLIAFSFTAAQADHNSAESLQQRLSTVGTINVMTEEEAAAAAKERAEQLAAAQAEAQANAGPVDAVAVYDSSCAACHTSGVAGAPKIGDPAVWEARVAQGMETLISHAINGFQGDAGVMPARGGNVSLSDEQVAAAVEYMVEQSQ